MSRPSTPEAGVEGRGNIEMAGETISMLVRPSDSRPRTRRADLVVADPRTVRRLRWHHVLTRRRRWSRELDRLLAPPSRRWWS